MSSELPIRASRRAATRRKVVVDEEDASGDEPSVNGRQNPDVEEEEDFAPAPKASPRRRAAATDGVASRKLPSRRQKAPELDTSEIDASQIVSPPESVVDEPTSPARAAPKRRSVKDARAARQSRVSRASIAPEDALPTPSASVSSRQSTPLGDITESTVNERTPRQKPRASNATEDGSIIGDATENLITPKMERRSEEQEDMTEITQVPHTPRPETVVKRIDPNITKLERPMDIVVRKRAIGVPQTQEPATPKERMTITYLILTNFKSYAGRQEVGPFHASFSSVVGPNGSGKSNVIDSLLFVFGFRASKMRQGKISALIHNSADYPDLEYCEVEVHFQMVVDQPTGGSTAIPDSQLVISRRAFKNNSSKYYINGKTSDFTTVTTLLKDRGVDLDHKRFLILQGEVESIAQMKPKAMGDNDDGLLEYLEDIIGTSKYKTPIEEAATETEALNEVCAEKSGRVQHVEKERNSLESKKDKALAFIRDENDLVLKQSALYQIYLAECSDNALVAEEAIEQIQSKLADELARYGDAEHEIKEAEKIYKAECKLLEKMQKQTKEIIDKADSLDKVLVKIEEKKKHLGTKRNKAQKSLDAAEFSIGQAETSAKRAEEDISRTEGEMEELEAGMVEADEELSRIRESLKGKTQGLSDEIALKQKQLEPWSAKINEKQSAQALAQSELDILRERENAGATAIADAEAKLRLLAEQHEAKSVEIEECETQHATAERDADTARRQLEKIAAKEPLFKSKLSNARQKAEEARASLSSTQSQGRVLAELTRLRESGRIEGFHGRLGNLGTIDNKYDVAISTACPSLDNMVVDSVEAAQQCIDYLRKNNVGRANFICLDKLAQRDLARIETPENCPRLFDLVKPKHDRFLPAFYSVLQNTLVARDSEQADRVAYGAKRWRVVSLEGKLIDKSGTMSGGGTRVSRGAMSSKVVADTSKDQVVKLEQDRDVVEAEYNDMQQQQRELEGQVRTLELRLPALKTQASKLTLELGSIARNIQDGEKRVQELSLEQKTSKLDKSKIAALEKSLALLEKEQDKLKMESEGIEAEIKELQDRIMEIGGVKLRGQKAKVDGLKEQIKSLAESRDAAEIEKAKAEKAIVKHGKAQTEATSELARISADLAQIEEEVAAQRDTSGNSAVRREADDAKQALEYKKEEIQDLKTELDRQTAELNSNRGAEVEMRNQLEDNQKHLAVNQKQQRHWQEKLGKLSLQSFGADGEEQEPEPVPELTRDELQDLEKDTLKAGIATLEERTASHPDLSVLAEYRRRVSEHTSRLEDLNAALTARDSAKKRTDDLRRLRLEGFMEGFSTISLRLKEMYQMITMGGNAELELVDSLDPFSEGILFSVMPPKKSWKNISNLSGGEKTLSSLALVFALHHYKPTPLYVMDEIDAALDFRNVSIVAAYIKERTKNAQFIVISLRNNMFELAARLVGVYKVNHMTKSVTVENREYITQRA